MIIVLCESKFKQSSKTYQMVFWVLSCNQPIFLFGSDRDLFFFLSLLFPFEYRSMQELDSGQNLETLHLLNKRWG